MNDPSDPREHEDLERLLRRMPLRHPSQSMDARLGPLLNARAPTWHWPVAAAALIAIGLLGAWMFSNRTAPVPPTPVVVNQTNPVLPPTQPAGPPNPVSISRTLAQVVDDGVVGTLGNAPVQRVRHRSVKQVVVIDPATGARLRISLPREDVMVMKVQPF